MASKNVPVNVELFLDVKGTAVQAVNKKLTQGIQRSLNGALSNGLGAGAPALAKDIDNLLTNVDKALSKGRRSNTLFKNALGIKAEAGTLTKDLENTTLKELKGIRKNLAGPLETLAKDLRTPLITTPEAAAAVDRGRRLYNQLSKVTEDGEGKIRRAQLLSRKGAASDLEAYSKEVSARASLIGKSFNEITRRTFGDANDGNLPPVFQSIQDQLKAFKGRSAEIAKIKKANEAFSKVQEKEAEIAKSKSDAITKEAGARRLNNQAVKEGTKLQAKALRLSSKGNKTALEDLLSNKKALPNLERLRASLQAQQKVVRAQASLAKTSFEAQEKIRVANRLADRASAVSRNIREARDVAERIRSGVPIGSAAEQARVEAPQSRAPVKDTIKGLKRGTVEAGKFKTAMHEAGSTLRQFFKYALGYGALYQVLGAVTSLVRGLVQLDETLFSIKAVSGATAEEMVELEAAIKNTATTTKFTLAEVASAAQLLVQSGVQPAELNKALSATALFASATNSALATSADLISTVRTVFSDLSDSKIADLLTKSVNISKLTGEDLKTIFSRGAQVSQAYNISGEQFLAAATVLRNAGIKASTVSTGLRQSVLELLSPDAKTIKVLRERYEALGENLDPDEITERFFSFQSDANPLVSVLRELRRLGAGGSGAKAFERIFDVRAQNVIKVLIEDLDELESAVGKLGVDGTAVIAADIQMQSLANSMKNLGAVTLSLADNLSGDLVSSLAEGTRSFTQFLDDIDKGLTDLKAKGESTPGILAPLLAGLAVGAKTPGGFIGKTTAGLATTAAVSAGLTTSASSGNTGATSAINAGIVGLSAGALGSSIFGGLGSQLFGDKERRSSKGLRKAGPILSKVVKYVPSLVKFLVRFAGPVGLTLSLITGALSFFDVFNRSNEDKIKTLKASSKALLKQSDDAKRTADALQAEIDNADSSKIGSAASKVEALRNIVNQFPAKAADALGLQAEEISQEQLRLIEEIGTDYSDQGGEGFKSRSAQLSRSLGVEELSPEVLARLQKLGSDFRAANLQGVATAEELVRQLNATYDGNSTNPEVIAKIENLRLAAEGIQNGTITTIEEALDFIDRVLKQGSGKKQEDLAKARAEEFRTKLDSTINSVIAATLENNLDLLISSLTGSAVRGSNPLRDLNIAREAVEAVASQRRRTLPGRSNRGKFKEPLVSEEEKQVQLNSINVATAKFLDDLTRRNLKLERSLDGMLNFLRERQGDKEVQQLLKSNGLDLADPNVRESLKTSKTLDEFGNSSLSLSDTGKKISLAVGNLQAREGEVKNFTSTLAERVRIQALNAEIEQSKRVFSLNQNTVRLLKERQALELQLLEKDRLKLDEGGLKDVARKKAEEELQVKENALRIKQTEELRKAVESQSLKNLNKAQESYTKQLEQLKLDLEDQIPGSTEYGALLAERNEVQDELLALDYQKVVLQKGDIAAAQEALDLARRKNAREQIKEANEKAAILAANASRDANRQTPAELAQELKAGGISQASRREQLGRSISALQNEITTERSKTLSGQEKIDSVAKIKDLELQLQTLNREARQLQSTLATGVFDGLDPETIGIKLQKLGNNISDLSGKISDTLADAIDSIGDKFVDAIAGGENFFTAMTGLVRDTLLDISRQIIKAQINNLFSTILTGKPSGGVTDVLGGAAKTPAAAAAGGVVNAVLTGEGGKGESCDATTEAVKDLGGIFDRGWTGLKDTFTSLFPKLSETLGGLFKGGGGLGKALSGGFDLLKTGAKAATNFFFPGFFKDGVVLPQKFGTGGMVKGPGGPRDDKIPAMLSNGEAVLNAKAVAALGPDFINKLNKQAIRGFSAGGIASLSGSNITSPVDSLRQSLDNSASQSQSNGTRVVNVLDPSLVSDYLSSSQGEEVVLNIMRRNPNAVQ